MVLWRASFWFAVRISLRSFSISSSNWVPNLVICSPDILYRLGVDEDYLHVNDGNGNLDFDDFSLLEFFFAFTLCRRCLLRQGG